MSLSFTTSFIQVDTGPWFVLLVDASLKGLVVLLLAGLIGIAIRRASAATRHLLWCVALIGLLAMPGLSRVLPIWSVPIPGLVLPGFQGTHAADRSAFRPASRWGIDPSRASTAMDVARSGPGAADARGLSSQLHVLSARQDAGFSRQGFSWSTYVLLIWAFGAMVILVQLLVGFAGARFLRRRADLVAGGSWVTLAQEVADQVGLGRRVTLRRSRRAHVPLTWGLFRPVLVLPSSAGAWPVERRRAVLVHELSHVRRWDWMSQMLAQIACALHWFNPLVWIARRRMLSEAEQACDDMVVAAGSKASDYAEQLLWIASGLRAGRFTSCAAVAMARPTNLEGRLLAVLDATRSRQPVTHLRMLLALTVASCLVLPLATARPMTEAKTPDAARQTRKEARASSTLAANESGRRQQVTGTVRLPDGAPASGAEVIVCTTKKATQISDGHLHDRLEHAIVTTGPDGRFSLPPQEGPFAVLVRHAQGYAQALGEELRASPEMTIRQWGEIRGTLHVGRKPGVQERIQLRFDPWQVAGLPPRVRGLDVMLYSMATTDHQGRFVFKRVPPIEGMIAHEIIIRKSGDYRTSVWCPRVPVLVKPGVTTTLKLGGKGRPVIGRVVLPKGMDRAIDLTWSANSLERRLSRIPVPPVRPGDDSRATWAWYEKWIRSPEGMARRSRELSYGFPLDRAGRFRIDDVSPGSYNLSIWVQEPSTNEWLSPGENIGRVSYDYVIPKMPEASSEEPFDLGTMELKLKIAKPR